MARNGGFNLIVGIQVLIVLFNIAFFGACCWIAWHFISKFW